MAASPIKLNGILECSLCSGAIAAGGWSGTNDRDSRRYLKYHLKRCEVSTESDRKFYRENGNWPRKAKPRSKR